MSAASRNYRTPLMVAGVLAVAGLFALGNVHSAQAQIQPAPIFGEAVTGFVSRIVVNTDNSVDVTETITYQTGSLERHGMYRDIRLESSQGRKMELSTIRVVDANQNPYQFSVDSSASRVRLKIGDPDTTFSGTKTYIISYHASKAVGQTESFDEIYWNVTGNDWQIPVVAPRAEVVLPAGVQAIQDTCYRGARGSTDSCGKAVFENGAYVFDLAKFQFAPRTGFTVAVGFQKGVVVPYDSTQDLMDTYGAYILAALIPLITFVVCFWRWYIKGRDDRETGTIIPYYAIDDSLTPMEAAGIALERINAQQIPAQIIYLATRGYLKIVEREERTLGFIKNTEYSIIQLKTELSGLNEADMLLMQEMFASAAVTANGERSVELSTLQDEFYTTAAHIVNKTAAALKQRGYYKHLGRLNGASATSIIAIIVFLVWGSGFFGGLVGSILDNVIPFIIAAVLSFVIFAIFRYFSPAKTEKGVTAKEHILGLKEYLQIAEKDRLEFHNAPERKPETFEKFLPYAMALGVAKIWAKEFEGIYTTPPSWYSGVNGAYFSAVAFNNSLDTFNTAAASSLTSSPSSSGSGGGGFSGGGGGGGGGGGW